TDCSLPASQSRPALANRCLQPTWQRLQQIEAIERSRGRNDFVVLSLGLANADVFFDRAREQKILLQDDSHLMVQRISRNLPRVTAVDQHPSLLRQIESSDQIDDRGFPAARAAD